MTRVSGPDWIPIARLLRPQGRRGELLAEPLSDLPGLFASTQEVLLSAPDAPLLTPGAGSLYIQAHWRPSGKNAGRIVLKLSGCDSISAAEALVGRTLLLARKDLPALDPHAFFVGDLTGCTLFNSAPTAAPDSSISPHPVGTVTGVEFITTPDGRVRLQDAAPLLAVATTAHAEPILIPFVQAWIDAVDIPAQRIIMRLPEGLLDPP
ncbi:MAG: ribosome maturation factor RimM [Acidobacteriaceae bacterium]